MVASSAAYDGSTRPGTMGSSVTSHDPSQIGCPWHRSFPVPRWLDRRVRQPLFTRWGRELDPQAVLQEDPRPQLARERFLGLNGWWGYAITAAAAPPATSC